MTLIMLAVVLLNVEMQLEKQVKDEMMATPTIMTVALQFV